MRKTHWGEELPREKDDEVRWKEYFVQLLNGDEITEVGGEGFETKRERERERVGER